jgi:hypothetical protein
MDCGGPLPHIKRGGRGRIWARRHPSFLELAVTSSRRFPRRAGSFAAAPQSSQPPREEGLELLHSGRGVGAAPATEELERRQWQRRRRLLRPVVSRATPAMHLQHHRRPTELRPPPQLLTPAGEWGRRRRNPPSSSRLLRPPHAAAAIRLPASRGGRHGRRKQGRGCRSSI